MGAIGCPRHRREDLDLAGCQEVFLLLVERIRFQRDPVVDSGRRDAGDGFSHFGGHSDLVRVLQGDQTIAKATSDDSEVVLDVRPVERGELCRREHRTLYRQPLIDPIIDSNEIESSTHRFCWFSFYIKNNFKIELKKCIFRCTNKT